jgi:MGT family glycosyltransferase
VADHAQALVVELEHRWGVELGGWRTALVTDGDATVCTTTSRVMGHDDLPPGWHYVGPLMEPIARVGHGARPLVYVALGTMFSFNPEPFARVIEALAEEPVDVFVAVGNAPVRDQLGSLPPNVSVHGYVDSRAVLARASVHVTHGGASSVHESIVGGVPMVCLPQGSDHNGWAMQIEALGIGEVVVDGEPAAIRGAVRRLLEDDSPRARVRELSEHLLGFDGAERLDRVVAGLLPS